MMRAQSALLSNVVLDTRALAEAPDDALIRALDGLDMGDFPLFASALTKTTVLWIDNKEYRGADTIVREYFDPISLLRTTHFATNVRVVRKSSHSAELSAKVLAQDYAFLSNPQAASSPPHILSGSFHRATLNLSYGQTWRMVEWNIKTVWSTPTIPEALETNPPSYTA